MTALHIAAINGGNLPDIQTLLADERVNPNIEDEVAVNFVLSALLIIVPDWANTTALCEFVLQC